MGLTYFGNYSWNYVFLTLLYTIIYEKRCVILTCIIGEIDRKFIDKKLFWKFWELCEMLGYWKVLWNYLEMNYVSNSRNLLAFYVLPFCQDVWLPGDYLTRYNSLCDIDILAPVFVMVIEFRLCDGDEFRFCDSGLVLSLWWHTSFVFVTAN